MTRLRLRELFIALGCYSLLQLWNFCLQAILLAVCLLVLAPYTRNSMMEGGDHASVSFDFELERLQLLGESTHVGRSEEGSQSRLRAMTLQPKKMHPSVSHQSEYAGNTLDGDRVHSKAGTAGEPLPKEPQHRYTLRPRSVYLSQKQRAVILAWLHDVEEAELGATIPALSYNPTKLGWNLPLTTRRLGEHLLGPNGGMRSCQAQFDASECLSSIDHTTEPRPALSPTKPTFIAKRGATAEIPSSLIMSKSHTVEPLCSSKQPTVAPSSNTHVNRTLAEKTSYSFGSSPLTSLDSSCGSSPVESLPTSVAHTMMTKSDQAHAKEDGRDAQRVDDLLSRPTKEPDLPRAAANTTLKDSNTSADRLFDLIAKLNA